MKVNIFKKLIREVIREELDYKFSVLEKKLDEALVSSKTNSIVEDRAPQPTASTTGNNPVSNTRVPMTKDSILNDILKETAHSGEWKNINKEAETKSVVDATLIPVSFHDINADPPPSKLITLTAPIFLAISAN